MALITPNRQLFQRPTSATRLPGGWQTGNPVDIARRYSGNAASLQSNLRNIGTRPQVGAAGPAGSPGPSAPPVMPEVVVSPPLAVDTAPRAVMPSGSPSEGVQPPQGNATQRWSDAKEEWKAAGGTNRTLNQANTARGVRPQIDGRATPSARNSTASASIRQGFGWERNGPSDLPY